MVQKRSKPALPPAADAPEPAPPKRRGRPRAYEPEVALAKALDLFRKDGFAGTSLDDLSAATGMVARCAPESSEIFTQNAP